MSRLPPDPASLTPASARNHVLRWLGQRELTASQARFRLRRRHYPDDVITTALTALVASGRVLRQVQALGVDRDTAHAAVAAVFAEVDEDRLLADALTRRLRGQPLPSERKALARLYGWLVRQGFDPGKVSALFRRGGRDLE